MPNYILAIPKQPLFISDYPGITFLGLVYNSMDWNFWEVSAHNSRDITMATLQGVHSYALQAGDRDSNAAAWQFSKTLPSPQEQAAREHIKQTLELQSTQ